MKRLISAAAAVMVVLTMAGCSSGNTDDKARQVIFCKIIDGVADYRPSGPEKRTQRS